MTEIEIIMIKEKIRTYQNDRDVLYRMISDVNIKLRELQEIVEFNKITEDKR